MICDRSLLTISQFCKDEEGLIEKSITYIHFHDNWAEATNGFICVKIEYPEHSNDKIFDFIIHEKALLSHIGRDILISPVQIRRIFSTMLKKGYHFLKDKIIIGSDKEGNSIIRYCREDGIITDELLIIPKCINYPDISRVIPVFQEEDIINFSLSADCLLLLSKIGKFDSYHYKTVSFKMKIESECKSGIFFSIDDIISGLVMPCKRRR